MLDDFRKLKILFISFSHSGRFIFLGSGSQGDGLLAYNASRNSVEGTACALREELKPFGVSVVTLESSGVPAESLFKSPIPFSKFRLVD